MIYTLPIATQPPPPLCFPKNPIVSYEFDTPKKPPF